MITTSSLKPEKASSAGITPNPTPASNAKSATRSSGSRPQTNRPMVTAIRPKAVAWSRVMATTNSERRGASLGREFAPDREVPKSDLARSGARTPASMSRGAEPRGPTPGSRRQQCQALTSSAGSLPRVRDRDGRARALEALAQASPCRRLVMFLPSTRSAYCWQGGLGQTPPEPAPPAVAVQNLPRASRNIKAWHCWWLRKPGSARAVPHRGTSKRRARARTRQVRLGTSRSSTNYTRETRATPFGIRCRHDPGPSHRLRPDGCHHRPVRRTPL